MPPMAPNDVGPCAGAQSVSGGEVVGDLAALIPQAGGRTAQPGVAGDADDGLDEGGPLGLGQGLAGGIDFDGAMLLSGPALVCDAAVSAGACPAAMAPTASDSRA